MYLFCRLVCVSSQELNIELTVYSNIHEQAQMAAITRRLNEMDVKLWRLESGIALPHPMSPAGEHP